LPISFIRLFEAEAQDHDKGNQKHNGDAPLNKPDDHKDA
jgi:hypothetical protein